MEASVKARILQRRADDLRFGIEQEFPGDSLGRPVRQRKSFTHGNFLQSISERLVRGDPDVRGSPASSATFIQVEGEQMTHHGQRKMARRPGMLDHRQLELAALHETAIFA